MNITSRLSTARPTLYTVPMRLVAMLLVVLGCTQLASAASWVSIHAIQSFSKNSSGTGYTTPYQNESVTTSGVVIAVLSDGFYIENAGSTLDSYAESWDSDTCTSEGIYVYTGTGNVPSGVALKAHVLVTGTVVASNSSAWAGTEISVATPSTDISVLSSSSSNSLPSTISSSVVTSAINNGGCSAFSADSFGQWLPFEGMRINVPSSSTLLVTAGTGGTVTSASATATTSGQFWALITSTTRPFRSEGIDVLDPAYTTYTASLPSSEQTWDGNPTLLLVNTTALGGTALEASAGTEYTGSSNLIGIVDYHLSSSGYTGLLLDSASVTALSSQTGNQPVAATAPGTGQITVAEQNLEQDATDINGLVSAESGRIAKLATAIVTYEHSPDVVAVQAATTGALSSLVSAISSAGGPTYTVVEDSSASNSADSNGLVNAFLVNADKFTSGQTTVTAELASSTWTNSSSAVKATFDRAPQLLKVKIPRTGISDYVLYVLNASMLSRTNLASSTATTDAQLQRVAQAEALISILQTLETAGAHVLVTGGLNSFEFSDGYVDTTGILTDNEVTSSQVWTWGTANATSLENTTTAAENLTAYAADSSVTTNPATSRYTYTENGSAEQPDQIFLTTEMSTLVAIDYARIGADFPVSETYTTSTVARASAHDAVIAYLTVPYPTETTVVSSLNPSDYDDTVTFTSTTQVYDETTGNADTSLTVDAGTVTFTDTTTGTVLCSAVAISSGTATCATRVLTVATHTITAAYSGSESGLGYQASAGTVSQVVNQDVTRLTLTSSLTPSYYGEPVTFTVTAAAAGLVDGVSTPTGGTAYLCDVTTVSGCTAGASNVIASGTLTSGTVTFSLSTLSIGTHTLEAYYAGDTDDTAATSSTITQVVSTNTTTLTVTSSVNPSYYGEAVTFTATAVGSYGTPTGSISFYDATTGTTLDSETLAAGTATYTSSATSVSTSTLSIASHTIQAIYAGDGTNAAQTAQVVQVVKANVPTVTVVSSENPSYYGDSVTFTATAVGPYSTPTGTVIFYDASNGNALDVETLSAASATNTATVSSKAISSLTVGTHSIEARFQASGTFAAATGSVSQVVKTNQSYLALTALPNSVYYGKQVILTATASADSGSPTGTVVFYYTTTTNSTPVALGSAALNSSEVATLTTTALPVGVDAVYAYYGGDTYDTITWHSAATSNTISVYVLATYSTVSTLSCTPNPQAYGGTVTCTDVVAVGSDGTGTPTGTVTFYDLTTGATLGAIQMSTGTASLAINGLTVGSHNLDAVYTENDPYLSSTSNTVAEVIVSGFTLTASPASASITSGQSASYTITVKPGSDFTLDVALSCTLSSSDTTVGCTVSPSTVTGGSGTATMVITTTAATVSSRNNLLRGAGAPLLAGLLALLLPRRIRKRGVLLAGLLLLGIFSAAGLSGCGSGNAAGGTNVTTYTATITGKAVDGTLTLSASTQVTLYVRSKY